LFLGGIKTRRHDNIDISLVMYEAMRTRRKGERKVPENESVWKKLDVTSKRLLNSDTRELEIDLGRGRIFWLPTATDFDYHEWIILSQRAVVDAFTHTNLAFVLSPTKQNVKEESEM
jgi:hypothetical protein